MRRIKLFENFNKVELESLTKSIDDVLVELGDIGLWWFISHHFTTSIITPVKIKNVIGVEIYKEPAEDDDEETNLFNFEDIFEPLMTLLSFMRDKYPDMTIEPLIKVNNQVEYDDWFEEFLEENDLESVTLDEVKQFTDISSFDIEFTI
jgi:hypothetical protein